MAHSLQWFIIYYRMDRKLGLDQALLLFTQYREFVSRSVVVRCLLMFRPMYLQINLIKEVVV